MSNKDKDDKEIYDLLNRIKENRESTRRSYLQLKEQRRYELHTYGFELTEKQREIIKQENEKKRESESLKRQAIWKEREEESERARVRARNEEIKRANEQYETVRQIPGWEDTWQGL